MKDKLMTAQSTTAQSRPEKAVTAPVATARWSGVFYLLIIVLAIFAQAAVRGSILVGSDAAATASNLAASEGLFRLGIMADLAVYSADIVLAVLFYSIFKGVDKNAALLASFFRIVMTALLVANLLNEVAALMLVSGGAYLDAFDTAQRESLALFFMKLHAKGFILGLLLFAIHCVLMGYLIFKSGFLPRILGVLMVISGLSYLANGLIHYVFTDYGSIAMYLLAPAALGEFVFTGWLLVRGLNGEKWMAQVKRA
jgi:hypothetical protein